MSAVYVQLFFLISVIMISGILATYFICVQFMRLEFNTCLDKLEMREEDLIVLEKDLVDYWKEHGVSQMEMASKFSEANIFRWSRQGN